MEISWKKLADFLNVAHKATYANKEASKSISLRPASEDYHFEQGNLVYHDTYFGIRDFLGEEIVYEMQKPVWGMNYCGYIMGLEVSTETTYAVLRAALMRECAGILPVRGPRKYIDGVSKYENEVVGELPRFSGEERICAGGKLIYHCWYHGGAIT